MSSFYFVYRIFLLFTFGRGTFSWSSVYPEKGEEIISSGSRSLAFFRSQGRSPRERAGIESDLSL